MNVFTYFPTLWSWCKEEKKTGNSWVPRSKSVASVCHVFNLRSEVLRALVLSPPVPIHSNKARLNCAYMHSHTYSTWRHTSSHGSLAWCDYNSNAIVPLYVNVYYFSRYNHSPLLLRFPIVPSTPHLHLHNWTFDWTLLPPLDSHADIVSNPKRGLGGKKRQTIIHFSTLCFSNVNASDAERPD